MHLAVDDYQSGSERPHLIGGSLALGFQCVIVSKRSPLQALWNCMRSPNIWNYESFTPAFTAANKTLPLSTLFLEQTRAVVHG